MLRDLRPALPNRDRQQLDQVACRDARVDVLEAGILAYLGRLRQASVTEQESQEQQVLMTGIINMENLADVIKTDLVELARRIMDQGSRFGDANRELVVGTYDSVCRPGVTAVRREERGVRGLPPLRPRSNPIGKSARKAPYNPPRPLAGEGTREPVMAGRRFHVPGRRNAP